MKARFPTLGAPLFAISLLVSACGTSSGGGGYYYPPNTSGDASGGGNGNDTGGSGGAGDTGGGGNGAAIFRNGGAQEAGSFAQLGVAPMAPPAAFGSSGLDGEWNVTFSSNFAYSSATLRIDERTARLEFPDKTVPVDGCPVVGSVSYVLEIAASDDLALLWREVNIKGSASCLGGQTGAVRQFLFPLRRISRGAGQFGALAGEWDPLKFGGYIDGVTDCRIRIDDNGFVACKKQATPILAWQDGEKLSGSFQLGGKVEWAATRTKTGGTLVEWSLPRSKWASMPASVLSGSWNVQFASWGGASSGTATLAGRHLWVAIPAGSGACPKATETLAVEWSGSGEFGIIWSAFAGGGAGTIGACALSMAEASGIIRRTSIEASAFDPFGGSWAYYQTGKWESSASVQVDGSGLKVLRETFPYGHAERKGPSISGGFGWGSASFTAVAN